MDKETHYRNWAIILLADIPADRDDNDPMLTERMQHIFDQYFADYQARYAGMTLTQRIFEGGEFTVPDSQNMKPDCIEEMRRKLTSFDINDISNNVNRIRLRRMLAFLDNMPKVKKGTLSHRMEAIIYEFKMRAGYVPQLTRKQRFEKWGKNREVAFDTINLVSTKYKKITNLQIESILPYLDDYPKAKELAEKQLGTSQKS